MESSRDTHPAAPEDSAHPFDRAWIVHVVVVACMVFIAWREWPTEARVLEMRARDYVSAASRDDARAGPKFMATSDDELRRRQASWAAGRERLAGSEVTGVTIEPGGQAATVSLRDKRTQATWRQLWVQQQGAWYHRADANP